MTFLDHDVGESIADSSRLRWLHDQIPMSSLCAPVRLLYPAVLELIFSCCTLSELHRVQGSCREWRTVLSSARNVLRASVVLPAELIPQCAQSSLGRHIAKLTVPSDPQQPPLSHASLLLLTERLPQLHSLRCPVRFELGFGNVQLPPALRVLELEVQVLSKASGPDACNAVLAAIGLLNELQQLTLSLPYAHPIVDFRPLKLPPLLRAFSFGWVCDPQSYSAVQYSVLRSWSTLESLTLKYLHVEHTLTALLQPPHELRLTTLHASGGLLRFNDRMAHQLLPPLSATLTDINLTVGVGYLAPLQLLPRLQRLTARTMMMRNHEDEAVVLRSVQLCTELRYLSLTSATGLLSASLAPLMCALPLLAELEIYAALDSLAFLSDPRSSLPRTLISLVIDGIASSKPRHEWMHLHSLVSLRSLVMRGQPLHVPMGRPRERPRLVPATPVRVPALDAGTRALFQPPSKVFPRLTYLDA